MFCEEEGRLVYQYDSETVWIEAWGEHALRVRATMERKMPQEVWALTEKVEHSGKIVIGESVASISNGNMKAEISKSGKIVFYNQYGIILLEEYVRNHQDLSAKYCSSLGIDARSYRGITGGDYEIELHFESNPDERIYGMGQYQQSCMNLKGCHLELAQRNSQVSIPFALSSLGYGFLWNNPAIGEVIFGRNRTTWRSFSSKNIDYWIVAGNSPAEIEEIYARAVGKSPLIPEYALGFWQSKLRYQTQEELLHVAREYKKERFHLLC